MSLLWSEKKSTIGIYYGIPIAFIVHSFDRSLDLRPYNRHLLANYGHTPYISVNTL